MRNFDDQIDRIRVKLLQAKQADSDVRVFGAAGHQYFILDPVTDDQVNRFEEAYGIKLPDCYRSFVTKIGNGGINSMRSAAGPYYGMFPFGEQADYLIRKPEKYLRNECQIFPDMSDDAWDALTARIFSDDPLSDQEYENEIGKVFGGLLPLGSQGCSFINALIVTGIYSGRVVAVDVSLSRPMVEEDKNFLDWYERWLDMVISGELIR